MPEKSPLFDSTLYPIATQPGIKRDGTNLDGNHYADGLWCRFRLGRPKKIGGYREIVNGLNGPIRGMHIHSFDPQHIIYNMSDAGVQCLLVDEEGVGGGTYDRTPAGFTTAAYSWSYDTLYDATGSPAVKFIAHAGKTSWRDIDDDTATPVYYGSATSTSVLTTLGQSVSGGVVVLQPFLFLYGSQGLIQNSVANNPVVFTGGDANAANVSGTKIVKGLPLRGGSNSPAGMFWALDSLIRVSFVGGTAKWKYDVLSAKSTILASNAVIDYDGVFYWPGIDRFLQYSGIIKEVPNSINQDFFFDNLNWTYRQKVWVTALPRWGEIWWFFPKGTSTECNHAVIYNVREGSWYDTPVSRSTGYAPRVAYFPVWADATANTDTGSSKYRIYRHETGTDAVYGENEIAIRSYCETSHVGFATGGPDGGMEAAPNLQTRITRIEPDFVQAGTLTASIIGASHAQAAEQTAVSKDFESDSGTIDIVAQRRMLRIRFESNDLGGNFHMGKVLMHLEPGDARQ